VLMLRVSCADATVTPTAVTIPTRAKDLIMFFIVLVFEF